MATSTQGDRIRALLGSATGEASIIAPFIKADGLRSLLSVVSSDVHLRCVTRWLPREVAAGVSDVEILDALAERGSNFSLSLADRLHAKLYVADDRCLVGSANVTQAALGEGANYANIEVLVETAVDDPAVVTMLEEISLVERPATKPMAEVVRRLADSLSTSGSSTAHLETSWFPTSRRPQHAYLFYTQPPSETVRAVDRILLADVGNANLQPGLDENEFRAAIRSLLAAMPIAETLLSTAEDTTLTRADARSYLEVISGNYFSIDDLWLAFVNWMGYFYADQFIQQEIAEIALRRAQLMA